MRNHLFSLGICFHFIGCGAEHIGALRVSEDAVARVPTSLPTVPDQQVHQHSVFGGSPQAGLGARVAAVGDVRF